MRKHIVALVFAFAALATAQNVNKIEENPQHDKHHSFTLTLDAPVKGDVTAIDFVFNMIADNPAVQRGLGNGFEVKTFRKISDVQYEVFGDDRPNLKTGAYRLTSFTMQTAQASTSYSYQTDYSQDIRWTINNPDKGIFPGIKSVEESH